MTGNFTWGFDGWVYACHGYANDSTVKGTRRQADHHPVGQHLPLPARRLATSNTSRTARSTRSAWPSTRWATSTPAIARRSRSANSCAAADYRELRQAPRRPRLRPADDRAVPRIRRPSPASPSTPPTTSRQQYRDDAFIGDVVTNRVNDFRLDLRTARRRKAIEGRLPAQRRPVVPAGQLKLGPDGALYVADFYNRIIGHYEVPLDHPGRDHERGRIWRIVYRGPDGKAPPPAAPRRLDDGDRAGADAGPRPPEPDGAFQGDERAGRARRQGGRRGRAGGDERAQARPRRPVAADARPVGAGALRRPGRRHADRRDEGRFASASASTPSACCRSGRSGATASGRWCWRASRTPRRTCAARPPRRWADTPRRKTSGRCSSCATPCRPTTRTCCTSSAWPCATS